MKKEDIKKISDWFWEISKSFRKDMRVPARFYTSEKMLDAAHNIAKIEKHEVAEKETEICLHRKDATRAFPGPPVLIPGSMGTAFCVLVGTEEGKDSFFSTNHGVGRAMSRKKLPGGSLDKKW